MLTAIECRNFSVSLKERLPLSGLSFPAMSEAGWLLLSLVLFMILGPFAGPVALVAVLTCRNREERESLPEPECIE